MKDRAALLALAVLLALSVSPVLAQDVPDVSGLWTVWGSPQLYTAVTVVTDPEGSHTDIVHCPGEIPAPPGFGEWGILRTGIVSQSGNQLYASYPTSIGNIVVSGYVVGSWITATVTYPTVVVESPGYRATIDVVHHYTGTLAGGTIRGRFELREHEDVAGSTPLGDPVRVVEDLTLEGPMAAFLGDDAELALLQAADNLPILGRPDVIWNATGASGPVADYISSSTFTIRAYIIAPYSPPTCKYSWTVVGGNRQAPETALSLTEGTTPGLWVGSFPVSLPDAIGKYELQLHFKVTTGTGTRTTDTSHTLYVTYDKPATDAVLLPATMLPLKESWLDFATSAAQGRRNAAEAVPGISSFVYQTGWAGAWHYQDPSTPWPILIDNRAANGNCVSFSDLWAAVGRMLGFSDLNCVRKSTELGFATIADVTSLDHQIGNAVGADDGAHRWVFGMHQIGSLGGEYYDPTFGRTYQADDEFIQWRFASQVTPDPVYLGLPRPAFDTAAFERFYWMHQAPPWGAWEYESLVSATRETSQALPLSSAFTGACSFNAVDANQDGSYDALEVAADLDLPGAGDYVLAGTLFMGATPVASRASRDAAMPTFTSFHASGPGVLRVVLPFSGQEIRDSALDGPYTALLRLISADGGVLAAAFFDSPSYSHLAFDETNLPPTMTPIADIDLPELWHITIQVEGDDPEGNPVELVADPLPEGATFDNSSGLLEWTPRRDQSGVYQIIFTASDGLDRSSQVVTITIADRPVFWDVPPEHWAFRHVETCYVAGIVSGYPDGTYQPSMSVTRDQMAVFLVRALGQEPTGPADPQSWKDAYGYDPADAATWAVDFTDVPASGWGDPQGPYWAWFHIQRLYETGVTQGITATEYGPAQEVRRDQMAVFLIRALGQECANPCVDTTCWPYDPASPTTWAHDFADIPATGQDTCHGAHWAWFHIQALYETGVTLGCGDGANYCPVDSVRRDEMAVFLARAFLGM